MGFKPMVKYFPAFEISKEKAYEIFKVKSPIGEVTIKYVCKVRANGM